MKTYDLEDKASVIELHEDALKWLQEHPERWFKGNYYDDPNTGFWGTMAHSKDVCKVCLYGACGLLLGAETTFQIGVRGAKAIGAAHRAGLSLTREEAAAVSNNKEELDKWGKAEAISLSFINDSCDTVSCVVEKVTPLLERAKGAA